MKVFFPCEPAEIHVVLSDHCRIRSCSLTEINVSVLHDHAIRMVIAIAWKTGQDLRGFAIRRYLQDISAFQRSAFRYIEISFIVVCSGPWSVLSSAGNFPAAA